MKIIDYFESDNKVHWKHEIGKSEWRAGEFLARLLTENSLETNVGKVKVLMLVEGDELISYCTYADKDDIQPTDLTPWIGWVYTSPPRRGHRYFGLLLDEAVKIAKSQNVEKIYISTNHTGLYEKYGCEFYGMLPDIEGEPSRIYFKRV